MTELQIDPEAINRYIAEKIAESVLGEKLKEAIDKQIKDLSYGSRSDIFTPLINDYIQRAARAYLDTDEVKDKITEIVTIKLTNEVVETVVDQAVNNLRSNRY